ncbi:hypothetical protein IRY61_05830 [Candidatus Saccharibacteria bacterium]|jgi:hypothetical protein|nr:hypothetical protein [Candidatus Saccharibacteria bacterium]
MSLTQNDLLQIRAIVREEIDRAVGPLASEVKALREDVKEIYDMIKALEKRVANLEKQAVIIDESFAKLPVKEQILRMHAMIVELAKKEGVVLPK